MQSPYEILGVDPSASDEEIAAAFKKRSLEAHPDRGGDKESFQVLNAAMIVVSCPERRRRYDETGEVDVEPLRQRAEHILRNLVRETLSRHHVREVDFMQEIRKQIDNHITSCKQSLRSVVADIKKQQDRLAKFRVMNESTKNTTGRFVVETVLRESLEQSKCIKANHEDQLKVFPLVRQLAEDLNTTIDDEEYPPQFGTMFIQRVNSTRAGF